MAARDDSVIRGSLIASLIFLVLSLALNFFLWRWGDTASLEAERATSQLASANDLLRKKTSQGDLMKAMLGQGEITEASLQVLRESVDGDADMEDINRRYIQDMSYFGPEVDVASRNYPFLPEYLVNAIRSRTAQYTQALQESITIRSQADSDIDGARKAQKQAESNRDLADQKLESANTAFTEDREKMRKTGEDMKSNLNKTVGDYQLLQRKSQDDRRKFDVAELSYKNTVENQKQELNRLRSDKFENVQGEIQYVIPPGELVLINLGSSDALRAGVQFSVISADAINLQDAPIKATIEVVKVMNANSSRARVIGEASYRDPLIAGDKLYSPLWAPGRKVRIALAGEIDIDGDGRGDTEQLRSMIELAGAEVVAVLSNDGGVEIDSGVRFLVVGTQPGVGGELDAAAEAEIGRIKALATEKGVTVIPGWKLLAYLKTINDSVTTPLGSAARGKDFAPETDILPSSRRSGSQLSEIYRNQQDGQ